MDIKIFVPLALLFLASCSGQAAGSNCDRAEFIEHVIVDVPVEAGTAVMPGMHFTKTWRVRNAGNCEWDEGYALVHTGGETMGGGELALPNLPTGETVDLSVRLTAPSQSGRYTGEWMLSNGAGELFGVGTAGADALIVELVVPELPAGVVYDFTQVICLARWDSGSATFLPCNGVDDEGGILNGYVREAKNGTIEVKPNNQINGWISGYFPPITIKSGDHFRATVGCVDENPDCNIVFMLKYRVEKASQASPEEIIIRNPLPLSGMQTAEFDFDLSWIEGNEVTLILYMADNGLGRSREAIGYWRDARIERER